MLLLKVHYFGKSHFREIISFSTLLLSNSFPGSFESMTDEIFSLLSGNLFNANASVII